MTARLLTMPALRLSRLPRPHAKHWFASLVLATTAGLYLLAGLSVTTFRPGPDPAHANVPRIGLSQQLFIPGLGAPPVPEPLQFRDVAPQDAVAINAAVPISSEPNPAARPYREAFATPADQLRATECLTAAIYYEAAIEPVDGQRAVAQVVLNRVRHPAFPKSVCGVVFQGSDRPTGCQFTFTCDGALNRVPNAGLWARARKVAEEALAGKVFAPVGWSTHYHTNWVVPYWSSTLTKDAVVGSHIFYRWAGGWGHPPAFRFSPTTSEPQIALMRRLTSDPSSLADAVGPTTTVVDPKLAAAIAAGDAPVPGAHQGSIDSFGSAVLRRYEPMSAQQATASAMARIGTDTPQQRLNTIEWALSGRSDKPQTPLGAKPKSETDTAAAPTTAAKPTTGPAAVKCLEGVRRLPGVVGPAQQQGC
ncbi:MAG TPA: cell wall hydrolase [Allosphingosinicella sp.]|jgi:spore germination cell wall hydrolase CwlJ-like protein|nr:cell wall hydrolase [Allosphingosinicella sp.]